MNGKNIISDFYKEVSKSVETFFEMVQYNFEHFIQNHKFRSELEVLKYIFYVIIKPSNETTRLKKTEMNRNSR